MESNTLWDRLSYIAKKKFVASLPDPVHDCEYTIERFTEILEEKKRSGNENSDQNTNARKTLVGPSTGPRIQPNGTASLASPSPIHVPRETR